MPFNPGGVFSLVASYFAQPGTTIRTEQHNPPLEDIGAALSQVLIRDGRAPMTGALNMNGFAINNIAAGDSTSSVATVGQTAPIGAVLDYAFKIAPPGWLLCYGQVLLSSTPYAALRTALINDGYMYGQDGSGNPKLPDVRGRLIAGLDNMGGVIANRLNAILASGTIGSVGGDQTHTLTAAQLAQHYHSGVTNATVHNHAFQTPAFTTTTTGGGSFGIAVYSLTTVGAATDSASISQSFVTDYGNGVANAAHTNVQPTMVMNKIIKASYNG